MQATTRVKKWGNSLAVRIPGEVAHNLGLYNSAAITFTSDKFGFYVRPVTTPQPSLEELVDKITPKNSHTAIDWGKPVGKEIW